jgi:hypothetical protein
MPDFWSETKRRFWCASSCTNGVLLVVKTDAIFMCAFFWVRPLSVFVSCFTAIDSVATCSCRLLGDSATVICGGVAGCFVTAAMDDDPRFETISTNLPAMLAIFFRGTPSLAETSNCTFRGSLCLQHLVVHVVACERFHFLHGLGEIFGRPTRARLGRSLRVCCSRESE